MQLSHTSPFATLPEQIAKAIAESIIKGEVAPGASLREIPLAEHFGVGRSSIREALRLLERDGVVSIRPRHGATVTQLNADEMGEIYQIRAALFGVAFELFAAVATKRDIQFLNETLTRIKTIALPDEHATALIHAELSANMASYICSHCGNKKLATLLSQMSLQVARYTKLGLSSVTRRTQSIANWESVIDALSRHDAHAANQAGKKMVTDNLTYATTVLSATQ